MKADSSYTEQFESRHIGPDSEQVQQMLKVIKASSVDELISQTIPANIRLKKNLQLPAAQSEFEFLNSFKKTVSKNKIYRSYIGTGYYNCITPGVILRNILENPGWYTAYTPYQAEIAQGRLEALINFQTMVIDLTGQQIANASLLDEATAAAEAMHLLHALAPALEKDDAPGGTFLVSDTCHPLTIDVVRTRARPLGIDVRVGDAASFDFSPGQRVFGVL